MTDITHLFDSDSIVFKEHILYSIKKNTGKLKTTIILKQNSSQVIYSSLLWPNFIDCIDLTWTQLSHLISSTDHLKNTLYLSPFPISRKAIEFTLIMLYFDYFSFYFHSNSIHLLKVTTNHSLICPANPQKPIHFRTNYNSHRHSLDLVIKSFSSEKLSKRAILNVNSI